MNPTRKSKLDDLATLQHKLDDFSNLSHAQQSRQRLVELQSFIAMLGKTVRGRQELAIRARRFGPCTATPAESDTEYYGRLRRWLDRDVEL